MLKRQIGGRWYLPWVVRLGAHLGREQVCFQGSVENLRTSAICLLPCDQKGLQENPVRRSTLPHGWTTGSWSLQWQTPCNVTRGPGGEGRAVFSPAKSELFCYRDPPVWASGVCNVKAWSLAQNTFESEPPSPSTVPLAPEKLVKSMDPLPRNRHSGAHFSIQVKWICYPWPLNSLPG